MKTDSGVSFVGNEKNEVNLNLVKRRLEQRAFEESPLYQLLDLTDKMREFFSYFYVTNDYAQIKDALDPQRNDGDNLSFTLPLYEGLNPFHIIENLQRLMSIERKIAIARDKEGDKIFALPKLSSFCKIVHDEHEKENRAINLTTWRSLQRFKEIEGGQDYQVSYHGEHIAQVSGLELKDKYLSGIFRQLPIMLEFSKNTFAYALMTGEPLFCFYHKKRDLIKEDQSQDLLAKRTDFWMRALFPCQGSEREIVCLSFPLTHQIRRNFVAMDKVLGSRVH